MQVREMDARDEEGLALGHELLDEAGLVGRVRVVVRDGEIRILPVEEQDPQEVLRGLTGCLGQEPAEAYDFHRPYSAG